MTDFMIEKAEFSLKYTFNDKDLLICALTHASSVANREKSNERLEFLGDAILGFCICEILYEMYSDLLEGELTKLKSTLVSRATCAKIVHEQGYGLWLKVGKGMAIHKEMPDSVLAGLYEALLGAIYLDGGYKEARDFIDRTISKYIEQARRDSHQFDFKSILQQVVQRSDDVIEMLYKIESEKGPDHDKEFESAVYLNGSKCPSGCGSTKKKAEQLAALEALILIGEVVRDPKDNSISIKS